MEKKYDHVIIGASRAGLTAAGTIRENRPDDSILVVNEEDRYPYKRTNLTKKLADGFDKEAFALYPEDWYGDKRIDLRNGAATAEILPAEQRIRLDSGELIRYGKLLVATGAEPQIPDIPGIGYALYLRKASDAEAIRKRLFNSRSVIVLGQGVEGVELAEQCRLMGCDVTVIGRDGRLLQRWLDEALSGRLSDLLMKRGVRCLFDRTVLRIDRKEERTDPFSLVCEEEVLAADLILASTGIRPRMELGESIGINGERGIRTDQFLETSQKGIYAAGDVLELPPTWSQGLWHSAEYQGSVAGLNMAGIPAKRIDRPTRLKCEVFGDFYFSMCYSQLEEGDVVRGWESSRFFDADGRYLKLFVRRGETVAGLMAGMDKAGAKILEKGIRDRLAPEEIVFALHSAS